VEALDFAQILQQLRSDRFRDITGARVSATVPVSERLINQVIAGTLPRNLPVRQVSLHPEDGNRLSLRLVPRAALIPALTIRLMIERQPEIPDSPVLVLRMVTLPALLGLAGAAFPLGQVLPPGVRLQGEVILVNLHELARDRGFEEIYSHLRQVRVSAEDGRLVLTLEAAVS
jgi:hypothetical protein